MNALALSLFAIAALASGWTMLVSWLHFGPKIRQLREELASCRFAEAHDLALATPRFAKASTALPMKKKLRMAQAAGLPDLLRIPARPAQMQLGLAA